MMGLRSQVIIQTLTQLSARAFMYAAMLIVLPSFVAIADGATYADIVLLATLAALSAQFDGGHATELVMALSSVKNSFSREVILPIFKKSLLGTLQWSIFMSTIFCGVWILISPSKNSLYSFSVLFISGVVLSSTCALANTATRVLFISGLSLGSSFLLVSGPLTGFVFLFIIRWIGLCSIPWITTTFVAGYMFVLIGTFFYLKFKKFDSSISKNIKLQEKKSNRRLVFFSQLVSIILAAKNPFLIRMINGNSDLALFSIYSACYALMISPAAAMQIPVLVWYRKLLFNENKKFWSVFIPFLISVMLSLFIGVVLYILISSEIFLQHFDKLKKINNGDLLFVILSSVVASISIVLAIYLTACGKFKFLAWMGILILIVDTFLVFSFSEKFGGITPMLTIFFSNTISIIAYFYCKTKKLV